MAGGRSERGSPFFGAGVALAFAFLVANALVAAWNVRTIVRGYAWVEHTRAVQVQLERTLSLLKDAETGQRGYLLTGTDDHLAPYRAAVRDLGRELDLLASLTSDNPRQQRRIAVLRGQVAAKMDELAGVLALRDGRGLPVAQDRMRAGRGDRAMAGARRTVAEMSAEEDWLLARRLEVARAATGRTVGTLAVGTGMALLLMLAVLILKHRGEARARASAEAIRRSENWLSTTLSSIGDGVIATDERGRVRFLNPVARSLTGWGEEAAGRPLEEVFPIVNEETRAPVENPVARVLATGHVVGLANHTILIARDGSERPIDDSAAPIRGEDGAILGVVLVFRDMTERRLADEAVRRNERRFRQLADSMPQIVWSARPDGFVDYYNRRWYEFTGMPEGAGGVASWEPVFHPDDFRRGLDAWYESIRTGDPYQIENRLWDRRRGEHRWFLCRALPARDESGRIVRWYGTATDIDGQKRAEAALREAGERKNEFLATLAHELRNPLAPVRNALRLLEAGEGVGEAGQLLAMMGRQVGNMARMVEDLLDVSRIDGGKFALRTQPVDLGTLARQAVESARPIFEERGQRIAATIPEAPIRVEADPMRIEQVFDNLLNNAARYSEPGGQTRLSVEADGEWALIRVADEGIGIEAEMLPRVFDLFVQAERRTERSRGGLGIGLSLVRSLVEMHGGRVAAHSEGRGRGTEFVVRLPIAAAGETDGVAPRPPAPARAGAVPPRRRVLIVDDNQDAAESMARVMARLYRQDVRVAYDGHSALEAAGAFRPEVVLLDIGLPGLDGYEVARRLRDDPATRGALIVAVTGWGQERDRALSREAGFDHHLVKPVEPDAIRAVLARAVERVPADG